MTFIGSGMGIVCQELEIKIDKLGDFAYSRERCFSLYESIDIATLLNIPDEYLRNFNAWIHIPSHYKGELGAERIVKISGVELKIPCLQYLSHKLEKAADIFSLIRLDYPQLDALVHYDITYTYAQWLKMDYVDFIKKYCKVW